MRSHPHPPHPQADEVWWVHVVAKWDYIQQQMIVVDT